MNFRAVFLLGALAWGATLASASVVMDTVTVYYNLRPPYMAMDADGKVSGLTATPARLAFDAAGIATIWQPMPTNRQLILLKEGGQRCAVGWFRNPEREQFAVFSRPIYRDKAPVALANNQLHVPGQIILARLLEMPQVRVLVKQQYSYGGYIDKLLERPGLAVLRTTMENMAMARMLMSRRADFFIASAEEASYLARETDPQSEFLKILDLPDMREGEERHIMCSKDVPPSVMARLDREIMHLPMLH